MGRAIEHARLGPVTTFFMRFGMDTALGGLPVTGLPRNDETALGTTVPRNDVTALGATVPRNEVTALGNPVLPRNDETALGTTVPRNDVTALGNPVLPRDDVTALGTTVARYDGTALEGNMALPRNERNALVGKLTVPGLPRDNNVTALVGDLRLPRSDMIHEKSDGTTWPAGRRLTFLLCCVLGALYRRHTARDRVVLWRHIGVRGRRRFRHRRRHARFAASRRL